MTLAIFLTAFAEPDVLGEDEQAYEETRLDLKVAVQEYPEEAAAWARWNAALPPAPTLDEIPLHKSQTYRTRRRQKGVWREGTAEEA